LLPTAEQDAQPFESQGSNCGMVGLVAGPLAIVVSPRPFRTARGQPSPFVKRLAQKRGSTPAPLDDFGLAAGFGYRSDAGVALQLQRRAEAVALRAEGGQQTRQHHRPGG